MSKVQLVDQEKYEIYRLPYDDDRIRGYYNPPLILKYNDNERIIGSGYSDDIELYQLDNVLFLLSINRKYYYVGLTAYEQDLELIGDTFYQNSSDIDDIIGDIDEMDNIDIVDILISDLVELYY